MTDTYQPEPVSESGPQSIAALSGASSSPLETQPAPTSGGSLTDLLGKAMAPPDAATVGQFTDLKQRELDTYGRQQANNDRRFEEDRAQMKKAFSAENAMIGDTPKWDVASERQKYKTDPIESFGSFASVFAMVASAFTRAPMENALNGAAAAMNAKREGNEFEYNRSFEAWKVNTDLAVKRFNMQHTALQDAFHIMDKDATRGNQKLLETMTKFGMEKELMLYQNGMVPEIMKVQESQLKMIEGVVRAQTEVSRMHETERHNKAMEGRQTADQEFAARWRTENPEGTSEQFAEAFDKFKQGQKASSGGGITTQPRIEAEEIKRRATELEGEGMSRKEALDKATKESTQRKAPGITPNRVEQLKAHIEQYDYAIEGIDRLEKSVKGVKGAFGIGGKIMRPTETFLNVVGGSNSTVYRQVEKEISELKLRTAKLLKDSPSSGRELSAVQGLIDSIVPGMNAGSSFQSVMQQMEHLKSEFKTIQKNAKKRLEEGTGGAVAKPDELASPPKADEGGDWWSTSPLKK